MKYYLAPLEGITNYVYRNVYHSYFENFDKYFTPFISTNPHTTFSTKERKEILPEHNAGLYVVPQILSNKSDDFIKTAEAISAYGYDEINLNLGCPSNTVVAKNKGSGFLFHTEALDQFLDAIYSNCNMKISIKTRLGKYDADEFYKLIEIFKKYPLEELIIHPRITKDKYKNRPNLTVYTQTTQNLPFPVCYNGDVFSVEDYTTITKRFEDLNTIMLGRGIIGNPGLLGLIKHGKLPEKSVYKTFHDHLLDEYKHILSGDRNVLHKMREFWFYMSPLFTDSKKYAKKIKKCGHLSDYEAIVQALFAEQEISHQKDALRDTLEGLHQ